MMLRRLKEDVEKNLAPKEETIIEVRTEDLSRVSELFCCAYLSVKRWKLFPEKKN